MGKFYYEYMAWWCYIWIGNITALSEYIYINMYMYIIYKYIYIPGSGRGPFGLEWCQVKLFRLLRWYKVERILLLQQRANVGIVHMAMYAMSEFTPHIHHGAQANTCIRTRMSKSKHIFERWQLCAPEDTARTICCIPCQCKSLIVPLGSRAYPEKYSVQCTIMR